MTDEKWLREQFAILATGTPIEFGEATVRIRLAFKRLSRDRTALQEAAKGYVDMQPGHIGRNLQALRDAIRAAEADQ